MSTEEEVVAEVQPIEEPVVEVVEPEKDSAFLEGFNVANGIETPAEPEPEVKTFAGYTEDELRKQLARLDELDKFKERESKVFGTLGNLKQSIEAIRNQPQPQAVAVTKESLKRLSAEYPEMAEMLAEDLKDALQGGATFDSSGVEKSFTEQLDKTSKTYEVKLLTVMHPDWKQTVKSDDFGKWRTTLTTQEQQELDESWDAISLGERISAFKSWKGKTIQTQQSKQHRLEAAITPKGVSQSAPKQSDEDAFYAGFKAVRGR